jgi:hypothetical protein
MDSNFNINVQAAGIFSKFDFVLQTIDWINPDFDNVFINNIDDRSLVNERNIFNHIFDQNFTSDYPSYECHRSYSYSKFFPIENSPRMDSYKKIVKKLKFSDELKENFEFYLDLLGLDADFLGVHIRLCDMNIYHGGDYGLLYFDDFLNAIKENKGPNTKIFVASDNNESIIKLKKEFGDDLYFADQFIRGESETEDTSIIVGNNFKDKKIWIEAFLEMLLLSKCGTLICRSSSLSNTSIIYSDTIKKIIRL